MKNTLITGILSLLVLLAKPLLLAVDPPGILNHQGSISVNTVPGTNFEPIGYVPVSVTDGNYSVVFDPPLSPGFRWADAEGLEMQFLSKNGVFTLGNEIYERVAAPPQGSFHGQPNGSRRAPDLLVDGSKNSQNSNT